MISMGMSAKTFAYCKPIACWPMGFEISGLHTFYISTTGYNYSLNPLLWNGFVMKSM